MFYPRWANGLPGVIEVGSMEQPPRFGTFFNEKWDKTILIISGPKLRKFREHFKLVND